MESSPHMTQRDFDTGTDGHEDERPAGIEKNREDFLIRQLAGHKGADLRKVAMTGRTPEAVFLAARLGNPGESAINETSAGSSVGVSEGMLSQLESQDSVSLYETISFLERHPDAPREKEDLGSAIQRETAEALGIKSDKWMDLIVPLFDNPKAMASVLEKVGSVPEDIFTKKKFKSVDPLKIAKLAEELRALEETPLRDAALHQRGRLTNHFLASRRAEVLRAKDRANVTLDSNGIFINLVGFHAHLPYGLIDEETVTELERGNWISARELDEIKIQKAKSNEDPESAGEARNRQESEASKVVSLSDGAFLEALRADGYKAVAERIVTGGIIIPDNWLESAESREDHVSLLLLAEEITSRISGKLIDREPGLLSGYSMDDATEGAYGIGSRIINSPEYYNVVKIAQNFMTRTLPSSAEEEFALFRGNYKKSKEGDQHSFVGAVHKGRVARILINEKKHVPPYLKKALEQIPAYDRDKYESLEAALRAFESFSASFGRLENYVNGLPESDETMQARTRFNEAAESCLHFLLTNATGRHSEAAYIYELIRDSEPMDEHAAGALASIIAAAKEEYSDFLYRNISSQSLFENEFSPEVHVQEVQFGEAFAAEAKERCGTNYDPELSQHEFGIRAVSINYRLGDPSETIPLHIEESCLDALRVNRNRPLINVIGGCNHLDTARNPLETFSDAIMRVAHKNKANVGVPGTQSGIGTVFGMQNIHYTQHFDHLPYAERAHFFAINPGKSVFFPGNEFMKDHDGKAYANISVDTLVTPVPAEWEKRGRERLSSKYLTHIAYMEALYHRMSIDQKQVVVVGNGGFYSVMEASESLKRNGTLLFVSDTGRFAEAASALVPDAAEILDSTNPVAAILERLQRGMSESSLDEFLSKDFGRDADSENEDYAVYRECFMSFLRLARDRSDRVMHVKLDLLEEKLEAFLASE